MLCNSARRLAPTLAGCRERCSLSLDRRLAVAGAHVSPAQGRWGCTAVSARREEQGQRRCSSTEAASPVKGLTLNVDEKIQRVKHRVPQKR